MCAFEWSEAMPEKETLFLTDNEDVDGAKPAKNSAGKPYRMTAGKHN